MEYCVKLKDVKSYIPEGHSGTVNCTLIDEKTGIKDFILIHGEVHPGEERRLTLIPSTRVFMCYPAGERSH